MFPAYLPNTDALANEIKPTAITASGHSVTYVKLQNTKYQIPKIMKRKEGIMQQLIDGFVSCQKRFLSCMDLCRKLMKPSLFVVKKNELKELQYQDLWRNQQSPKLHMLLFFLFLRFHPIISLVHIFNDKI